MTRLQLDPSTRAPCTSGTSAFGRPPLVPAGAACTASARAEARPALGLTSAGARPVGGKATGMAEQEDAAYGFNLAQGLCRVLRVVGRHVGGPDGAAAGVR
jgi:hypothetical protein